MKLLGCLLFCTAAFGATVGGSAQMVLDWHYDGGITYSLSGSGISISGDDTPGGRLLSCITDCNFSYYSHGFGGPGFGDGQASIGQISSNRFAMTLSGDTYLTGTLTLYTPQTLSNQNPPNTVIATAALETYMVAGTPVITGGALSTTERTFNFYDSPGATTGGVIANPEPGYAGLLLLLLLFRLLWLVFRHRPKRHEFILHVNLP